MASGFAREDDTKGAGREDGTERVRPDDVAGVQLGEGHFDFFCHTRGAEKGVLVRRLSSCFLLAVVHLNPRLLTM